MPRNNRHDDEEENEGASWMATYSDMMTLLFAFFVLLFAISNVDAQKFALLAAGLSKDGINAETFIEIKDKYNIQGVGDVDPNDIEYPGPDDAKDPDDGTIEEGPLNDFYNSLNTYIETHSLEDSVSVELSGETILLTLRNDIWFVSGSAAVTPVMEEKGRILARLLRDEQNPEDPFDITVVGHTDNVPIGTVEYPNNWWLSSDRANAFLYLILEESGLEAKNFSAKACGEEQPIADNDTEEGRQANRRVEIVISYHKTA